MRTLLAILIFVVVVGLLTVVWATQHQTQTLPLVVDAPRPITPAACPKLSNPCDKIACWRPNTKEIA